MVAAAHAPAAAAQAAVDVEAHRRSSTEVCRARCQGVWGAAGSRNLQPAARQFQVAVAAVAAHSHVGRLAGRMVVAVEAGGLAEVALGWPPFVTRTHTRTRQQPEGAIPTSPSLGQRKGSHWLLTALQQPQLGSIKSVVDEQ